MAFTGWPSEAIDFYDGLEEDNSRDYWMANKATYETAVKEPMVQLLSELEADFGPAKIFRPNRDVRFSSDKSPYKTAIAASLANGGYIQLSAAGLGAGRGMYMMAPDQLERYRDAVAADATGEELVALVTAARRASIDVSGRDSLKTAPRGYPKDHPRVELLRHKGLVSWKQWPAGPWLATRKAKSRVIDFLHAAKPISDWLDAHVGASTMPDPGRR